jgi:hypothetical protein
VSKTIARCRRNAIFTGPDTDLGSKRVTTKARVRDRTGAEWDSRNSLSHNNFGSKPVVVTKGQLFLQCAFFQPTR